MLLLFQSAKVINLRVILEVEEHMSSIHVKACDSHPFRTRIS